MRSSHHVTFARRKKRLAAQLIAAGIVIAGVAAGTLFLWSLKRPAPYRQSIVVSSDPAYILSWNASRSKVTVIQIPDDVVIPAAGGYGTMRVHALLDLDRMEQQNGTVYTESISESTGIPVFWYAVSDVIPDDSGAVSLVRRMFSFSSAWLRMTGRVDTSIPLGTWISYVFAARNLTADAVSTVGVSGAFVPEVLPDGTQIRILDTSRFDYLTGTALWDTDVRSENVAVAVYNTTSVPAIGQQAARMMEKVGVSPVLVGNSSPERSDCLVRGKPASLSTNTAQFIADYFGCSRQVAAEEDTAAVSDLQVYLGRVYASRFRTDIK